MLLPCSPASVSVARRMLGAELRSAGVMDSAVRDAALVISELLSNAILHAYPLAGERLQVAWSITAGNLELSVSDGGSPTRPHAENPTSAEPGGRGLSIVETLSQRWGVRTDDVGLTVWAILAVPRKEIRRVRKPAGQRRVPAGTPASGQQGAGPQPATQHRLSRTT